MPPRSEAQAMLQPDSQPLPGVRLVRHLGAGGFGEVWEATNKLGTRLALKFLPCRGKAGSLVANEVRVLLNLRKLQHPNLIRLHDVCATTEYLILQMELAEGNLHDLQTVYREAHGRGIPADHLLDLLDDAAAGLDFLAASRSGSGLGGDALQHCDVKPGNLLLVGDRLKVADFGLCSTAFAGGKNQGLMGTPGYAAPEQYEGRPTARSDQFALAVTYVELVTSGRAVVPPDPSPLSQFRMPVDLTRLREREFPVLAKALDLRWTNRWPSCKEFIAALRKVVDAPRRFRGRTPLSVRVLSPELLAAARAARGG
jgi:serine/threonine protein kinase